MREMDEKEDVFVYVQQAHLLMSLIFMIMDSTDLRHVDVCVHRCVYRVSIGHVHNTSGRR
jgi:hypothetical protein